jgi:hypothetical protein
MISPPRGVSDHLLEEKPLIVHRQADHFLEIGYWGGALSSGRHSDQCETRAHNRRSTAMRSTISTLALRHGAPKTLNLRPECDRGVA